MTHRKYFSLVFTIVFILFSVAVHANKNTGREYEQNSSSAQGEKHSDNQSHGKQVPFSGEDDSKVPHGKTHVPHSEELPHIHKFHKERVKKIKKHHGKYWLLSQVLLFLCHAAILYMSYLHAAS